jgi:hypothetical protein
VATLWDSVAENLLAALALLLLGFFARPIVSWIGRRFEDSFTAFTEVTWSSRKQLRIVYGLVSDPTTLPQPFAQDGDVSSLATALLVFSREHSVGAVTAIPARSALADFRSWPEVLSISGPIWNPVTADIMAASHLPVRFASAVAADGGTVDTLTVDQNGVTTTVETRREDGVPRECYGLVLSCHRRIPNSRQTQHAVVVAGISTLGTFGALHWLGDLRHQKWHEALPEPHRRWCNRFAVVRVTDSSPLGFSAHSSGSEAPSFLNVEVVAYGHGAQRERHESLRRRLDWRLRAILRRLHNG